MISKEFQEHVNLRINLFDYKEQACVLGIKYDPCIAMIYGQQHTMT